MKENKPPYPTIWRGSKKENNIKASDIKKIFSLNEYTREFKLFILSIFIFGLGDAFLIQSNIGNGPWSVLAQGISQRLDITLGWSTFAISGVVLLAWIPLREKPGFGTLSNLVVIAIAIPVIVYLVAALRLNAPFCLSSYGCLAPAH